MGAWVGMAGMAGGTGGAGGAGGVGRIRLHTRGEMELLSQGVKPWDEDAHTLLAALNNNGDYY